ncbi:hypothetical protein GDO86_009406 [Hymenochirus boettgeri]|uniref:A kinase-anchoring proteins AKAP-5 and AKAP-12 calmodulin (CaM)-binding domain-containing protein n=1 Tax=Hymenochirus boettgeri TaxID=247094 RepID=A0A8T2JFW2_9PIPI|nr:hypothetical protein GDO86_009406 [Hymenochirus boettgeri]
MLGTITLTVVEENYVSAEQNEETTENTEVVSSEDTKGHGTEDVTEETITTLASEDIKNLPEEASEPQSSEVGFKKVFKFVGFRFTVKKDKVEKTEPVQLLTVKQEKIEDNGEENHEKQIHGNEKSLQETQQAEDPEQQSEKTDSILEAVTVQGDLDKSKIEADGKPEERAKTAESPTNPNVSETYSPLKKFFSTSWAGLRKKTSFRKSKEEDHQEVEKHIESKEHEQDEMEKVSEGEKWNSVLVSDDTSKEPPEKEELKVCISEEIQLHAKEEFLADLQSDLKEKVIGNTGVSENIEDFKPVEFNKQQKEDVADEELAGTITEIQSFITNVEEAKEDFSIMSSDVKVVCEKDKSFVNVEESQTATNTESIEVEICCQEALTTEAELLSSQENAKLQGSPLRKLFSGNGLKRLSGKKHKGKKEDDSKAEDTKEQVPVPSDIPEGDGGNTSPSSPEELEETSPTEKPSEDAPHVMETEGDGSTSDGEKKKDGITPWASFKKLVTPKKYVKRSSESDKEEEVEKMKSSTMSSTDSGASAENQEETKENNEEQKLERSTEEKKKVDSSVSWEALICVGSAKKRARKTSDSDEEEMQKNTEDKKIHEEVEKNECESDSPLVSSQEKEQVCDSPSPEQASSPTEGDGGSTWQSFKRLVTPRRKSRTRVEEKTEEATVVSNIDQSTSDGEAGKEESWVSFKKLIPGRKKKKSDGKQEDSTLNDTKNLEKDCDLGEDDSDVPAVVPLSEYDAVELEKLALKKPAETLNHVTTDNVIIPENATEGLVNAVSVTVVEGERAVTSLEERAPSWISASVTEIVEHANELAESKTTEKVKSELTVVEAVVFGEVSHIPDSGNILINEMELTSEALSALEEAIEYSCAEETTEMLSAVSKLDDSVTSAEEVTSESSQSLDTEDHSEQIIHEVSELSKHSTLALDKEHAEECISVYPNKQSKESQLTNDKKIEENTAGLPYIEHEENRPSFDNEHDKERPTIEEEHVQYEISVLQEKKSVNEAHICCVKADHVSPIKLGDKVSLVESSETNSPSHKSSTCLPLPTKDKHTVSPPILIEENINEIPKAEVDKTQRNLAEDCILVLLEEKTKKCIVPMEKNTDTFASDPVIKQMESSLAISEEYTSTYAFGDGQFEVDTHIRAVKMAHECKNSTLADEEQVKQTTSSLAQQLTNDLSEDISFILQEEKDTESYIVLCEMDTESASILAGNLGKESTIVLDKKHVEESSPTFNENQAAEIMPVIEQAKESFPVVLVEKDNTRVPAVEENEEDTAAVNQVLTCITNNEYKDGGPFVIKEHVAQNALHEDIMQTKESLRHKKITEFVVKNERESEHGQITDSLSYITEKSNAEMLHIVNHPENIPNIDERSGRNADGNIMSAEEVLESSNEADKQGAERVEEPSAAFEEISVDIKTEKSTIDNAAQQFTESVATAATIEQSAISVAQGHTTEYATIATEEQMKENGLVVSHTQAAKNIENVEEIPISENVISTTETQLATGSLADDRTTEGVTEEPAAETNPDISAEPASEDQVRICTVDDQSADSTIIPSQKQSKDNSSFASEGQVTNNILTIDGNQATGPGISSTKTKEAVESTTNGAKEQFTECASTAEKKHAVEKTLQICSTITEITSAEISHAASEEQAEKYASHAVEEHLTDIAIAAAEEQNEESVSSVSEETELTITALNQDAENIGTVPEKSIDITALISMKQDEDNSPNTFEEQIPECDVHVAVEQTAENFPTLIEERDRKYATVTAVQHAVKSATTCVEEQVTEYDSAVVEEYIMENVTTTEKKQPLDSCPNIAEINSAEIFLTAADEQEKISAILNAEENFIENVTSNEEEQTTCGDAVEEQTAEMEEQSTDRSVIVAEKQDEAQCGTNTVDNQSSECAGSVAIEEIAGEDATDTAVQQAVEIAKPCVEEQITEHDSAVVVKRIIENTTTNEGEQTGSCPNITKIKSADIILDAAGEQETIILATVEHVSDSVTATDERQNAKSVITYVEEHTVGSSISSRKQNATVTFVSELPTERSAIEAETEDGENFGPNNVDNQYSECAVSVAEEQTAEIIPNLNVISEEDVTVAVVQKAVKNATACVEEQVTKCDNAVVVKHLIENNTTIEGEQILDSCPNITEVKSADIALAAAGKVETVGVNLVAAERQNAKSEISFAEVQNVQSYVSSGKQGVITVTSLTEQPTETSEIEAVKPGGNDDPNTLEEQNINYTESAVEEQAVENIPKLVEEKAGEDATAATIQQALQCTTACVEVQVTECDSAAVEKHITESIISIEGEQILNIVHTATGEQARISVILSDEEQNFISFEKEQTTESSIFSGKQDSITVTSVVEQSTVRSSIVAKKQDGGQFQPNTVDDRQSSECPVSVDETDKMTFNLTDEIDVEDATVAAVQQTVKSTTACVEEHATECDCAAEDEHIMEKVMTIERNQTLDSCPNIIEIHSTESVLTEAGGQETIIAILAAEEHVTDNVADTEKNTKSLITFVEEQTVESSISSRKKDATVSSVAQHCTERSGIEAQEQDREQFRPNTVDDQSLECAASFVEKILEEHATAASDSHTDESTTTKSPQMTELEKVVENEHALETSVVKENILEENVITSEITSKTIHFLETTKHSEDHSITVNTIVKSVSQKAAAIVDAAIEAATSSLVVEATACEKTLEENVLDNGISKESDDDMSNCAINTVFLLQEEYTHMDESPLNPVNIVHQVSTETVQITHTRSESSILTIKEEKEEELIVQNIAEMNVLEESKNVNS